MHGAEVEHRLRAPLLRRLQVHGGGFVPVRLADADAVVVRVADAKQTANVALVRRESVVVDRAPFPFFAVPPVPRPVGVPPFFRPFQHVRRVALRHLHARLRRFHVLDERLLVRAGSVRAVRRLETSVPGPTLR